MGKQRLRKTGVACVVLIGFGVLVLLHADYTSPPPHTPHGESPGSPSTATRSHSNVPLSVGRIIANDDSASSPWTTERSSAAFFSQSPTKRVSVRKGLNEAQYVTINNKTYPLRTYYPLMTPNDPLASQWWTTSSRLDQAWDIAPGSYQTTLAIIDTGFALEHEDLQGRWHQNMGEIGSATSEAASKLNCTARGLALDYACNLVDDDIDGIVDNEAGIAPYENPSQLNCTDRGLALAKECNRLDDDSNGYADDVRGWDVVNQDSSVQAGELSPNSSYVSHGTMVAGVAAANGNNAKGIAGANWQTIVLPIQALDDDGYGNTRSVGESIYYAIEQGADIINISLGSEYQDDYVRQAIEAANAAGVTVVAAAGNDGCDCVSYPARYPEVIAVGAHDETGNLANFSSWGLTVDLTAPGTGYTLPAWSSTDPTTRYVGGVAGTSFSSPLVAGMAALLKSHQPSAQPLHLVAALHETTNRAGLAVPNSRFGFGKFDAYAARNRMVSSRHAVQAYALSPVSTGNFFAGESFEATGTYVVEDCQSNIFNIPIYELKSATSSFFSASEAEVRYASSRGYSPVNFAYSCLRQPHDTVGALRVINVFREFRNISPKP